MTRRIGLGSRTGLQSNRDIKRVADAAARAALSPKDGEVVLQLDTDELYVYDGGSTSWVLASGALSSSAISDTTSIDLTVTAGVLSADVLPAGVDHNSLANTHNLTTDIDHNSITNAHNLTTDIDHNSITNTHNLTTDIDHNSLTNYSADEHRTINDSATGSTDLWSASKIDGEVGAKQDDVITTRGDVIVGNSSNIAARLAIGASGYVLASDGTDVSWQALGSFSDTYKLKCSSNDSTPEYLETKLVVSDGTNTTYALELTTLNDGSNEDVQIQFDEAKVDHNSLLNTHNLTTDIDHNSITNTHNLTTDIDHDSLTNTHQGVDTTDNPSFVNVTSTGVFKAAAGSISAPSYSFTADTDTGIYNNSTNEMVLTSGGNAVLKIQSDFRTKLYGDLFFNTDNANDIGATSVSRPRDIHVGRNVLIGGSVTIGTDLTVNGTTVTLNTSTLDVEDVNITVNNGGNQASADDAAGITVEMSDATDCKIIYDKDATSKFRCGEAGSEIEIATISASQTLTNKTIDVDNNTVSNIEVDNLKTGVLDTDLSSVSASDDTLASAKAIKAYVDAQVAASGGGAQYESALAAENIDATSYPKSVCLSQRDTITVTIANSWIDIDEGGGEVSTQVLTGSDINNFLLYDIDQRDNEHDLAYVIEDALNSNGSLSFTYTVTYSSVTRKITIGASSSVTIKWSTGTHSSTNIGNAIGFDVSADDSGTSMAADYAIDSSNNNSLFKKAWVYKTDADYIIKSRNYDGIVDTSANKAETCTVKIMNEAAFSSLQGGSRYYTTSAAIVVDATNNKIDFKEGAGSELNGTIDSGTYYRGNNGNTTYSGLCAAIKTAMEAVGALTFTVTYDTDTEKFTIAASGACTLLLNTGTNAPGGNDTAIYTDLGWDTDADTSSTTSHTADNKVDLAGEIGTSSESTISSVYVGKGTNSNNLFAEKNHSISAYDPVYQAPGDWQVTPYEKDYAEEIQLIDEHMNSSGYGVRIVVSIASAADYYIQYTKNGGSYWLNAGSVASYGTPGNAAFTENFGGNYHYKGHIRVDENGKAVAIFTRYDTGTTYTEVWTAYSEDLASWTIGNSNAPFNEGTATDWVPLSLTVRNNKAYCIITNASDSVTYGYYSDYSSGYGSWTQVNHPTWDWVDNENPCAAYVQYFSEQAGANQYRLISWGRETSAISYVNYAKGDASSITEIQPFSTQTGVPLAHCQDELGLRNRVGLFYLVSYAGGNIKFAFSNEDYNGGTLTWNNHTLQDITGGAGITIDQYNGYSSAADNHANWNGDRRAIMVGDFCGMVYLDQSNPSSKIAIKLAYSKDVTSGTWESPINIGSASGNCQEVAIAYIPSIHGFVVVWKLLSTATLANNLTNGQIFSTIYRLESDNTPTRIQEITQIDGGEAEAGFQGFVTISKSADGASVSWEKDDGSYDIIVNNVLI